MLDFAGLATAFSGIQLAVVVAVFLELHGLKDRVKDLRAAAAEHEKQTAAIDKRLAHVMGRLKIEMPDED